MSRTDGDPVEIDYDEIVAETKAAVLFRVPTYEDETEEMWIPKSQLIEHDEDACTFEIPEWLAREKGMV